MRTKENIMRIILAIAGLAWASQAGAAESTSFAFPAAGSGAGSVRLSFPEGTRIEADLNTGIGSARSQFDDTKGAGLRVSATSGVGSVAIVKS